MWAAGLLLLKSIIQRQAIFSNVDNYCSLFELSFIYGTHAIHNLSVILGIRKKNKTIHFWVCTVYVYSFVVHVQVVQLYYHISLTPKTSIWDGQI